MRGVAKKFILVMLAVVFAASGIFTVRAAARASLRSKLERATDEEIREFYYTDLNGDGKKEAVAVTSRSTDEIGYEWARLWYISDEVCDVFYESGDDYLYDPLKLYSLKGTKMLCCCAGAGGSGYTAYAWVFDKKGPKAVKNVMSGVSQIKGSEFVVLDTRYDGASDNTGLTHNQYFARWDGVRLVEYGGLRISEAQLKKAENGAKILKEIDIYGEIQSIYYRANGMVFINLCDGIRNRNVALTLKNGRLSYYDYGQYGELGMGEDTALKKATGDGLIHKSITDCVRYPKRFPMDEK